MIVHMGWVGAAAPRAFFDAVKRTTAEAPRCTVTAHVGEKLVPSKWQRAPRLPPHMRSDIQRHCILKEFGGLWLDADVRVLVDPAEWANKFDKYTAIRLSEKLPTIGTDIIYIPAGWGGWGLMEEYIDSFFKSPPSRITVLHFAGDMIATLAKQKPQYFDIIDMKPHFPFGSQHYSSNAVVARGFDPQPGSRIGVLRPPGLGDMVKSGLSAVGITEELLQAITGKPCNCPGRAAKLNEWGHKYLGLPPGRNQT